MFHYAGGARAWVRASALGACPCGEATCVMCSLVFCSMFVVVVEIIKSYLETNGAHLATTGYVAPSPNHVQYNVPMSQLPQQCFST